MTWLEKFNIRKAQLKKYIKYKKVVNRAKDDLYYAEKKISTAVSFDSVVTEYDWPADAPCRRKIVNDLNGFVDSDNPPFVGNVFEYKSYCDNFPLCTETTCQHYPNYAKTVKAREKLKYAQEALDRAKAALKEPIK